MSINHRADFVRLIAELPESGGTWIKQEGIEVLKLACVEYLELIAQRSRAGASKSKAKSEAARANGKKGGRPKKPKTH